MTADENKQQAIDSWTAFATRDAAQIREYFKEDAVWIARFIANDFGKVFVRDAKIGF